MSTISGNNSSNLLIGSQGDDTIHGAGGDDLILGRSGDDALFGDSGDDWLLGDDGTDALHGGSGSDLLVGGSGDDSLSGGSGTDAAVYTGRYSDYRFVRFADGAIQVTDLRAGGPDGVDTVSGVEWFVFRNRVISSAALTFAATLAANDQGGVDITLNDASALDASLGTDGIDHVFYSGAGTVVLPDNIENVTLLGTADSSVVGNDGDNVIIGNSGNNTLTALGGNDFVDGGDGDDTVIGGSGHGDDTYIGGDGIDTVVYASTTLGVTVDLAAGTASGPEIGNDTLISIENVEGGSGGDVILGDGGANALSGGAGNDLIDGRGGDDTVSGGDGDDTLIAGPGGDVVNGGADSDLIVANYNDHVGVVLSGIAGSLATGYSGTFDGSAANDIAFANIERFQFTNTGLGADTITTGDGEDLIRAGLGIDVIQTAGGNDFIDGGPGADVLDGGAGTDTATYESSPQSVTVDLSNNANNAGGEAQGDILSNIENLTGSGNPDSLTGDGNANVINGGIASDALFGQDGNDVLIGGTGSDSLDGGNGNDFASYRTAATAVLASLANPAINTGDAAGDSYASIERLEGGDFNDQLTGNAGGNFLRGGPGGDALDGGAGSDTADYFRATAALTVDLGNPASNTGEAVGDSYVSIENLRGGVFADILRGDANINLLDGGPGADTLDGGGNSDFAWYNSSPVGITASLANPTINTGDAAGDTYISIERLAGSNFDDVLIGDGTNNFLRGQAGADALDGGGGNDTADYFNSAIGLTVDLLTPSNNSGDAVGDGYTSIENLRGSQFDDVLRGDNLTNFLDGTGGADELDGQGGGDFAWYNSAAAGVTASLANPAVNTGDAAGDSYISIENLAGSNLDDTLIGDGSGNFLRGQAGGDILDGGAGPDWADYANATSGLTADLATPANNTGDALGDSYISIENLRGGTGNDSLRGNAGNNFLRGGAGADVLNGRGGFDTADYFGSPIGLTVDLATPANNTGEAAGDTYLNIENLRGSNSNDTLRGDAGGNFLDGAGGADVLDGGGAIDQAWYNSASAGVTASLANPAMNTGDAAGDTYISIEGLFGSSFADTLIGDADRNFFVGSGGGDAYFGGGHFDTVGYGGANAALTADLANPGNNTGQAAGDSYDSIEGLDGSSFNDVLRGNGGDNLLSGGAGADGLDGGGGFDTAGYAGAASGVTADLSNPGNNTGDAVGDTYTSIEGLSGSGLDDTLAGDGLGNRLQGQGGNDTLDGQGGDDTLTGETTGPEIEGGNDILTGGSGDDTFLFVPGFGHDTVSDFVAGAGTDDVIEFDSSIFADFAAVVAASAQDGADVVITFDVDNTVRLQNVALANLHADDLLFG
jgi:Ca2+-binding RTX toxin-like protein